MREILFRGKTLDGEWIEGDLLQNGYDFDTSIREKKEKLVRLVIPETIGQYTGITDKNGTRIFEGDIISIFNNNLKQFEILQVEFDINRCRYVGRRYPNLARDLRKVLESYYEVIGNIHDNPELLKGGEGK